MSELFNRLKEWRDAFAKAEIASGKPFFMDKPNEWFEDPHFFCESGHVSNMILKCEEEGDLCLECRQPVFLGPRMGEAEFRPILIGLGGNPNAWRVG